MRNPVASQTSNTAQSGRAERYEHLLAARLHLGRDTIDAVCHGQASDADRLFHRVVDLDARLGRFRRYSADYLKIAASEDLRWHVPPGRPEDDVSSPCSRCLRAELDLRADLVLLPTTRRSA
jgi:hypothetical protein